MEQTKKLKQTKNPKSDKRTKVIYLLARKKLLLKLSAKRETTKTRGKNARPYTETKRQKLLARHTPTLSPTHKNDLIILIHHAKMTKP